MAFVFTIISLHIIQLIVGTVRQLAVRGSLARYTASTWDIALCTILALTWATCSIIMLIDGDIIAAIMSLIVSGIWLWAAKKMYDDEDNWFKDAFGKLSKEVKKLRERLSTSRALPSPA